MFSFFFSWSMARGDDAMGVLGDGVQGEKAWIGELLLREDPGVLKPPGVVT